MILRQDVNDIQISLGFTPAQCTPSTASSLICTRSGISGWFAEQND